MGKFSKCICFLLYTLIFNTLFSNSSYAQLGRIDVKVHVVDFTDYKPIENAYVIIKNLLNPFDSRIGMTNADGDILLSIKRGEHYILGATHPDYKISSGIEVTSDAKLGNPDTYTIQLVYNSKSDNFDLKTVNILVKGKDYDGTIKPLDGAIVYTCGVSKPTNSSGIASFPHRYQLGSMVYFAAFSEGYSLKEDNFIVGSKPQINDNAEIILERIPLTTVPIEIQVLDKNTDKPVPLALVTINLRTPVNVNGQTKTIWGSEHTNTEGIADFTAKTEKPIPVELVNSNEFYVTVTGDKYQDALVDLSKELLIPSQDPRLFTVWLKPKEEEKNEFSGSGLVLQSFMLDPELKFGSNVSIEKNKLSAHVKNSKFIFTISEAPKFIKDGESYTFELSLTFEGDDDNLFMEVSFNVQGCIEAEIDNYNLTVGKKNKTANAKVTVRKSSASLTEAVIQPQIFGVTPTNQGPFMFQAKYIWKNQ